ncbi:MAG: dihydrodipicolinate synthase family protein [bacterium]|nr:dihydrodipicolinate synthase family protein [bacterium]
MDSDRQHIAGILPPITTPFDDAGGVDLGALAANIERYNRTGLSGYVAFGSNGEAVHLSAEERGRVLETLRRSAAPGRALIAGVNEQSTVAAIRATRQAADAGADMALVITPYFYKAAMTQGTLRRFFLEVADASPLPILIYNIPQNTGVMVAAMTFAELAKHHNVAGLKDSSGNMAALSDTLAMVPGDFDVLVGSAAILYPALAAGAAGAILAVACVAPAACIELFEMVGAGDHARALDLQRRLAPLASLVTTELGIAGLKAVADLAGFVGGAPRGPLTRVNETHRPRIEAVMRDSGFFDRPLS